MNLLDIQRASRTLGLKTFLPPLIFQIHHGPELVVALLVHSTTFCESLRKIRPNLTVLTYPSLMLDVETTCVLIMCFPDSGAFFLQSFEHTCSLCSRGVTEDIKLFLQISKPILRLSFQAFR